MTTPPTSCQHLRHQKAVAAFGQVQFGDDRLLVCEQCWRSIQESMVRYYLQEVLSKALEPLIKGAK